jgi:hypothetical protein
MSDLKDFDPATYLLVQAAEAVADELDCMAQVAAPRGLALDEIDDLAQQAIFA